MYLGAIFTGMFGKQAAERYDNTAADEELDYTKVLGRWRGVATRVSNNSLVLIMAAVSKRVKQPISHALLWIQKRDGEVTKASREAHRNGKRYLGPTSLSDLVV